MGIASLIIGIISFIIGIIPACGIIALVPAVIGLLLGIIEIITKSKKQQSKGLGIAGTVVNGLAVAFILFWTLVILGANADTIKGASKYMKEGKVAEKQAEKEIEEEKEKLAEAEAENEAEEEATVATTPYSYRSVTFQIPEYFGEEEDTGSGSYAFSVKDMDGDYNYVQFEYSKSKTGYDYNKIRKKYSKDIMNNRGYKSSDKKEEKDVSVGGAKSRYVKLENSKTVEFQTIIPLVDRAIFITFTIEKENFSKYNFEEDYATMLKTAEVPKKLIPSYKKSSGKKSGNNNSSKTSKGVSKKFKAAMDKYEKWFNRYIKFIDKYNEDPITYMEDYGKWLAEYEEMMDKFNAIEDEDLNAAETAYYLKVQARIMKKLSKVSV
ncbi:MAG: hypothetical protein K6D02_05085 [Lachnospiraceae bacterium]|nr:hypothetical protein [Lachnospiraceae bacterium]